MQLLKFMQRKEGYRGDGNNQGKDATMVAPSDTKLLGDTNTIEAQRENALEEKRNVILKFRPPVCTELEIEQKVYPDSIRKDQTTEVLYTAIVKNTKRAVAKNVALSLVNLPPWFKASKVMLDGETLPDLDGGLTALQIGDIAPGESKWVVIAGIASP